MPWDVTRSAYKVPSGWLLWSFLQAGPAPWTPQALSFVGKHQGEDWIRHLAKSPYLREVRELTLMAVGMDAEGLGELVASEYLEALEVLRLDGNSLGDAGMQVLASSPRLASLRVLEVAFCDIGDVGLSAIASSPYLRELRELDLHANPFTDEGVQALVGSANVASLESLNLSHTSSPVGRQKLFFMSTLPYHCPSGKLRRLGLQALAQSSHLTNLHTLYLSHQPLELSGWIALASSSNLPSLKRVSLHGSVNRTWDADSDVFWSSPYWADVQLESASAPTRRSQIQQQPEEGWATQTALNWRLFAYACLPRETQVQLVEDYLQLAAEIAQEPQSFGWLWCQRHLLTWSGKRLCQAAERFAQFEALQHKRAEEADRERWWGESLEELLFSK